jgi:hypothetical protein
MSLAKKAALLSLLSSLVSACIDGSSFGQISTKEPPATFAGFDGCLDAIPVSSSTVRVNFEWPESAKSVSVLRNGIAVFSTFSGTAGRYSDSGLQEGMTYSYTCTASFASSSGDVLRYGRNQLNVTTLSVNPPTFAGIFSLSSLGNAQVRVRWSAPTGVPTAKFVVVGRLGAAPSSQDFDGTGVDADLSSGHLLRREILDDAISSTDFSALGDGLSYQFAVQACSSSGVCSSGDGTNDVMTLAMPDTGAPQSPGVSFAQVVAGQVVLTAPWTPSQGRVAIRRVYRCGGGACGTDITNYSNVQNIVVTDVKRPPQSLTLSASLAEFSSYSFIVRDEDELGQLSQNTSVRSINTGDLTPPASFAGIRPSAEIESLQQGTALIKWGAPPSWSDYRGFLIYLVDGSNNLTPIKDCACSGNNCPDQITQCTVTGLDPYRTYKFHVRAYDASGNTTSYLNPQFSVASKRVMDSTPPTFSSALQLGFSGGVTLDWSAGADNQYASEPGAQIQYQVWRKTGSTFATASNPNTDADTGAPLLTTTSLSHVDSNVVGGSTYFYTICALDASSNRRCDGNVVSRTVADIIAPTVTITHTKTQTNKVWNLALALSDNSTPNAELAVTIRRKVSESATDFPQTDDSPLVSGAGITALNNEGTPAISGTAGVLRYVNYLVTVTDAAGNTSSATQSILLDNVAPTTSPVFGSLSPASPSNSSTAPRVIGSSSANTATLKLYSNAACSTLLASGAKAQFEGAGIQITLSANTTTSVYAQAETSAATTGACVLLSSYTHDNVAPTLASFSIGGAAAAGASISRSITWGALSETIASYCVKLSSAPTSENTSGCSWTSATSLPATLSGTAPADGTYSFVVWVRDAANNTSSRVISSNSLSVDASAPLWLNNVTAPTYTTEDSSMGSVTYLRNATDPNGTGVDRYQYAVGTSGANSTTFCPAACTSHRDWTDISNPSFTPTTSLLMDHNTTYFVSVRVLDVAGNYTVYSRPVIADLQNPSPPLISSPAQNAQITVALGSNTTLSGSCEVGSTITATGGSGVSVLSASCSAQGALSVVVNYSGLSLMGEYRQRSISLFATKPSGRSSVSVNRDVMAIASCPTNYLLVSGNANYATMPFCVAKFEMKAVDSTGALASGGNGGSFTSWGTSATCSSTSLAGCGVASRPDGTPLISNQRQALYHCDRLNGSTSGQGVYQLIANSQWQTLADAVTSVGANWSSGTVGVGQLTRGHTDGVVVDPGVGTTSGLTFSGSGYGFILAASTMDGTTQPFSFANAAAEFAAGYRGTGNSTSSSPLERRTHYLPSGEVIWDVGGNMWEWTRFGSGANFDDDDTGTTGSQLWSGANSATRFNSRLLPPHSSLTTGHYELSNPSVFADTGGDGGLQSRWFVPSGSYWNNTAGTRPSNFSLGGIATGGSLTGTAVMRGGGAQWNSGSAGVWTTNITGTGTVASNPNNIITGFFGNQVGFRCVAQPYSASELSSGPASGASIGDRPGALWTGLCDERATHTASISGPSGASVTVACSEGQLTLSAHMPTAGNYTVTTTASFSGGVTLSTSRSLTSSWTSCPANYVLVPGNAAYGTASFCAAKFEMKAVTSNPVGQSAMTATLANSGNGNTTFNSAWWPDSRPDGTPLVQINQRQSIQMCDRLNSGASSNGTGAYQLITNAQWQTLAANITATSANWSGGSVGSGGLNRGHTDSMHSDPNQGTSAGLSFNGTVVLGAASVDLSTTPWTWLNSPNAAAEFAAGYRGTGNTSGQAMGSGLEQRRTHYLSSGDVIWDVAGNVWEWVRYTQNDGSLDSGLAAPSGAANSSANYNSRTIPTQSNNFGATGWYELSNTNLFSSSTICSLSSNPTACTGTGGLNALWLQPSGSFWNNSSSLPSSFNMGRSYSASAGAASSFIVIRGGSIVNGADAGVFSSVLDNGPTSTYFNRTGFRCVYSP